MSHQKDPSSSPGGRLRQLLATGKTVVCPGVYDGFSARMALAAGFECLYMTGAGVSMSRIGMADLGLATQTEMVDAAGMIANIDPKTPLIADAECVLDNSIPLTGLLRGHHTLWPLKASLKT